MRTRILGLLLLAFPLSTLPAPGQSQETMTFKPAATSKFAGSPDFPPCGVASKQDGKSGGGLSILLLKFEAGCVLPWHWHTPNERLMMISGSARNDMKDMEPVMLNQGDFLMLPSSHTHKFTAISAVQLFLISDAKFDIHYVDAAGKEISAEAIPT
jgi:mannose-6-phosphate isomerase-like protein (cupin superfamily)